MLASTTTNKVLLRMHKGKHNYIYTLQTRAVKRVNQLVVIFNQEKTSIAAR
jgi:hypothetical protein